MRFLRSLRSEEMTKMKRFFTAFGMTKDDNAERSGLRSLRNV